VTDHRASVLIVGAGAAGLTCALQCAEFTDVTVISKGVGPDGATAYAQGGIAAASLPSDSIDQHIEDTLKAGAGLNDIEAVIRIISQAPQCVTWLSQQGVPFVKAKEDQWALGLEGGHQHPRVVHVADRTGWAISQTLRDQVNAHPKIQFLEGYMALDLIVQDQRCVGIDILTPDHTLQPWATGAVVLATGGFSAAYLHATHDHKASGDGLAMALRAGCALMDLEFNQFHPTCLYCPGQPPLLLSEALRGEGARLRLPNGEYFMKQFDADQELAPRDRVARAIDSEMKRCGLNHVLLDISHQPAEKIQARFPHLYKRCLERGFDMTQEPLPVVPAAHYSCGGVHVDSNGQTEIFNLYAVGETACTGLHGANRLASNSLLECIVTGMEVARQIQVVGFEAGTLEAVPQRFALSLSSMGSIEQHWHKLQSIMWNSVGIVRSDARLISAMEGIQVELERIPAVDKSSYLNSIEWAEYLNVLSVAAESVRSAYFRRESRGLHYTVECPQLNPMLNGQHTLIRQDWDQPRYTDKA